MEPVHPKPEASAGELHLPDMLNTHYGIAADTVSPTEGGWSAKAYDVHAAGRRYFLKQYDTTRTSTLFWINRMEDYLPAFTWMMEHSPLKQNLPQLVRNCRGNFKTNDGRYIYLLFDFITGIRPELNLLQPEYIASLARLLAALHECNTNIPAPMDSIREDTSLPFADHLSRLTSSADDLPEDVRELFTRFSETISNSLTLLFDLRDNVRLHADNPVFCHTDIHGWNIIQADRMILLDWEGLCLAPAEADLFILADAPEFPEFLRLYQQERPAFQLNQPLLFYYRFRRWAEDTWEFVQQILYDRNAGEDARKTALAHLEQAMTRAENLLTEYCLESL